MKRLLSFLGALLTLTGGFNIYLIIAADTAYSYEDSVKLLANEFKQAPVETGLISLGILLSSSLTFYLLDRFISLTIYRRKNLEERIKKNQERLEKISCIRDQFYEKVFIDFKSVKEYPVHPAERIKGKYSQVNVKDINDTKFPESLNWWKHNVFNYATDGVEVYDGQNIIGFQLWMNDKGQWDVLDKFDKPRKNLTHVKEGVWAISYIPYENIIHVDWMLDPIYANITISCKYLYKTHMRHPFKEFRYYWDYGNGFMRQFEPDKRRNLKKFDPLKPFAILGSRLKNRYWELLSKYRQYKQPEL